MTADAARELITRYYDACSAGDVDGIRACVTEDVVHYFLAPNPGSAPVRGADALAHGCALVQAQVDGRWVVDHLLAAGDEAVIEWTLFWRHPAGGDRIATRGAEWYRFRDGRICEVRAYHQQRRESSELEGFDYAGRGYSRLGAEASAVHESPPGT